MAKTGATGLTRVFNATRYSMAGFAAAFRHEAAFRQELLLCAILVPLALWLGKSPLERALMVFVCLLVPVLELFNSAIEAVVDRIGDEHHPLAGRAKDLGSAVVFAAILNVCIVWGIILFT